MDANTTYATDAKSGITYYRAGYLPTEMRGIVWAYSPPPLIPLELISQAGDFLDLIGFYAHIEIREKVDPVDLAQELHLDTDYVQTALQSLWAMGWIWNDQNVAHHVLQLHQEDALRRQNRQAKKRAHIHPSAKRPKGEHVVYRIFGENKTLLYVGVSVDCQNRYKKHRQEQPWWNEVVEITGETFHCRTAALAHELAVIQELNPRYNKSRSGHLTDPFLRRERQEAGE